MKKGDDEMRGKMLVIGDQVKAKKNVYLIKITLMHGEGIAFTDSIIDFNGDPFGRNGANEKNLLLATIDTLDHVLDPNEAYIDIKGFDELLRPYWKTDSIRQECWAELMGYDVKYIDSVGDIYEVEVENFGW